MSLTIVNLTNPQYANATNTAIKLQVQFAEITAIVPFIATNDDIEPHGLDLYRNAVAGKYGPIAPYPIPLDQQLATLKTNLCAQIDQQAETIRDTYITPGSGQAMVYQEKSDEAKELQSDPSPDPANYPILSASVGIEGSTIQEVASLVLATKAAWTIVAAAIETARLGGKSLVNAASTMDAANAVYNSITWPPSYSG